MADSGGNLKPGAKPASNSHFDLWEGEAPAEPTSNLAISFDFQEISGFGGSLTLPETGVAESQ